jgi:hypothetical protein
VEYVWNHEVENMLSLLEVTVAFRIWSVRVTQAVLSYLVEASGNADLPWVRLHDRVSKEETSLYHPSGMELHGLHTEISSASASGISVALRVSVETAVQATSVSL